MSKMGDFIAFNAAVALLKERKKEIIKRKFLAFLFVFAIGLLTSLTPCIYPMIPITIAVLGKEAHARSRWQNILVSICYVLGIGVTFSALGVFAASTGALFGSFMSSAWVLGFVCLVFFAMSLSMFGLFEIQAPQFLRDGILSHLHLHGYLGAFVSGLLAGVVASPCVGPVLVGVLTFVAQTQSLWLGFWLLFTYALGMGVLFLVFPSKDSLGFHNFPTILKYVSLL
jgi:thiol:disulfide interchange protein DsbD